MSSDSSKPETGSRLVVVALGANLGNPAEQILSAAAQIRDELGVAAQLSSLWQTEPVDCPPGSPAFLNAVMVFLQPPDLTPQALLATLQAIEARSGRNREGGINEPRPIDLDIITFAGLTLNSPELTLPHPRAHTRRFVLSPLAEIAPDLVLPHQYRTIAELLAVLPERPAARQLA